jgi:flagellar biosynthesis GTPase FlhF
MEDDMSSLQVLLTAVHQIDASLRLESIPKKVILLMGQTKAGKTTLFYYLSGKKLVF